MGEKEKRRQAGMLITFAKRYQEHIPELQGTDVDAADAEEVGVVVREFLHGFLSLPLRAYLEAGRLSGFRRLKELVQEASAQLDSVADSTLAAAMARSAAEDLPQLSVSPDCADDVAVATSVARAGLAWLADHGLLEALRPVLLDAEASTQLRLKRVLLEVRRGGKTRCAKEAPGLTREAPCRPAPGLVRPAPGLEEEKNWSVWSAGAQCDTMQPAAMWACTRPMPVGPMPIWA